MKSKRILGMMLSLAMMLSFMPTVFSEPALATDEEIKITYNGEIIETDTPPVIIDGRTLVPARAIFEQVGMMSVFWDEKEQDVWGISEDVSIILKINSDSMRVTKAVHWPMAGLVLELDGYDFTETETITIDVPAQIINDRTMIPVRAVAEAMDITVDWDAETRTVILTDEPSEPELTPGPIVENPSFALKLKEQMPSDKNYMVSPFSIKIALAMTANGGDGAAKEEILETLEISDLDEFNEYVKKFIERTNTDKETNAEAESEESAADGEYRTNGLRMPEFEIANSIWLNKDYSDRFASDIAFAPEFVKLVAEYYDGTADVVNNKNAVEVINNWISEKTREKITDVIEDPEFLAALVNTIYMKAQWMNQFNESATEKDVFTDRNGKETEIDFMNDTDHYAYYRDADTQMVRLPYLGSFSMYVVLGDSTNFEAERELMDMKKVHISLPKWKTESEFELKDILKGMGVEAAFDGGFNNMFINWPKSENVFIDDVIHKTYIDVDEKGTEAAAVTVIMMGATSMPMPEEIVEFKADKPFTYFICDDETGEILFMGEYAYSE